MLTAQQEHQHEQEEPPIARPNLRNDCGRCRAGVCCGNANADHCYEHSKVLLAIKAFPSTSVLG